MRSRAARLFTLALAAVATIYFASVVQGLWSASAGDAFREQRLWASIGIATLLAMATHAFVALAFHRAVRALGAPLRRSAAVAIVWTSQFAKYIPGNVGPWIGRPALASRYGVPVSTSVRSLVYETLLTVAVGGVIGLLLAGPRSIGADGRHVLIAAAVTAGVLLATALVPRLERWISTWPAFREAVLARLPRRDQLACAAVYGINFVLAGLGLVAIAQALGIDASPGVLVAAFALAWIAGFVVPGPPAGLGIREAVLVAMTTGSIDATAAAQLVIAHRIATTLSDLLAFAAGSWLLRATRAQQVDQRGTGSPERAAHDRR